jgi:hypothetical protein
MLLPQFNQLTGKQIVLRADSSLFLSLLAITIITGLVSGSYPALYLSGFKPIKILKLKYHNSFAEVLSRKGLVVFQFSLSVILIISVLVIYQQIQFIQNKNPGYNKDHVIRFSVEGKIVGSEGTVIAELKKIPGVINASYTFNNMVGRNFGNAIEWEEGSEWRIYQKDLRRV